MSEAFRKVRTGDRTRIPARSWNAAVDAAKAHKASQFDSTRSPAPDSLDGLVLVRNSSGADVERFHVLALESALIAPADNLDEFQNQPAFEGVGASFEFPHFAVLQEPIADGEIGQGMAAGVTAARVTVDDEDAASFADCVAGSTTLVAAASGQAEILWREGGVGDQWALVRIGNSVSFGAGVASLGIVVAPSTEGATAASYTVDVYGTSIASLSAAPTATAQTAIQFPAESAYFRGEVVGLRRLGGLLVIQKLLSMPIAYTVTSGQIGLRMTHAASAGIPTNFVLDLFDALSFFNGGAEIGHVLTSFSINGYFGLGGMGVEHSVPVVIGPGWSLASPLTFDTTLAAALAAAFTGSPSSISNGQETFSVSPAVGTPPLLGWSGQNLYSSGTFVFVRPSQGITYNATLTTAVVHDRTDGGSSSSPLTPILWPALSLPSITGGIDSAHGLLFWQNASTNWGSAGTGGSVNKVDPFVGAGLPAPAAGMSRLGSYIVYAAEVLSSLTVS